MQDASIQLPSNQDEMFKVIRSFEAYFVAKQHKSDMMASELTAFETAIIASFIVWLRDHAGDGELAYAHHQAG